jgi:hypothetical protein
VLYQHLLCCQGAVGGKTAQGKASTMVGLAICFVTQSLANPQALYAKAKALYKA